MPEVSGDRPVVTRDSSRAARLATQLAVYRWPLVALLLSMPLVAVAVSHSLAWIGQPFPGFFVLDNRIISSVGGVDWVPDRAAIANGRVLAIDDRPVPSAADVYRAVAEPPLGTPIAYTVARGGERQQVVLPTRRFGAADYWQTFGVLLLFGCAWLAFGLIVGVLQPHQRAARVYLWQSLVGSLFPVTAIFLYGPASHPGLTHLHILLQCLFGATWLHLALVFPVDRLGDRHAARRLLAPYGAAVLLAAWTMHGFAAEPPDLRPAYWAYGFVVLGLVVFLVGAGAAFARDPDGLVRARVKAIVPGVVPAVVVAALALIDAALSRQLPLQLGIVLAPLFSAGIAYGIARHDLFDIDRVLRQSFVYAALSVLVAGGYAIVLTGSAHVVPWASGTLLGMIFVAGLAVAMEPLRRAVQRAVDRAFYRTRADYQRTIGALSDVMTTLLNRGEIVERLTAVLLDEMHLQAAAVCALDGEAAEATIWTRGADGALREQAAAAALWQLGAALDGSGEALLAADVPGRLAGAAAGREAAAALRALGAELIVPLLFRRRVTGLLCLGRPRSGRPLTPQDLALLHTLANQTAIALANAAAVHALEELTRDLDATVRERTAALRAAEAQLVQAEKMASLGQLVAGVAHELNNPASFVAGSIENLCRYVERLAEMVRRYEQVSIADAAQARDIEAAREATRLDYVLREAPALLRACAEGSERIKRIVDDLRVFVRADRGARTPVDVADGLRGTLRLLAPRLQGIRVATHFDAAVPVEADEGQLNQVWMNLVGNAVDALAGRPDPCLTIRVRGRGGDAAGVEVEIADTGAGIDAAVLPRVFEPFFTTKPVGRGTGLGLSIAYGAVQSHGGTLAIDSAPGRGTTVTVRLPARAAASAA